MTQALQTPALNTAETILEAAAEIFAEKGYEGARVDELARAAGVNKATLYYQIGDKEALYHAVLDRILKKSADEITGGITEIADCEEQIRHFITTFARNTKMMRYTAPIMLREVASGGRNLPESALTQMGRILGALDEALERGVRSGRFRPVNAFFVHMMIVGSLMLYSANEPIRRRNAENHPEIYRPDHFLGNEEAGATVTDLVLASIRAHEGTSE